MSTARGRNRFSGGGSVSCPNRVSFAAVMSLVAGALHLALALAESTALGVFAVIVPGPSFGPLWLRGGLDLVFVASFCNAGAQLWRGRRLGRVLGIAIASLSVVRWALHLPVAPVLSTIGCQPFSDDAAQRWCESTIALACCRYAVVPSPGARTVFGAQVRGKCGEGRCGKHRRQPLQRETSHSITVCQDIVQAQGRVSEGTADELGRRTSIERFFGRVLIFFRLQCPPVFGWPAFETRVALTYVAVWVIALAAWQAGRPDLKCSPCLVLAHVWEGMEM